MKRNILIRISLIPLKFPALLIGVIFIALPCILIAEREFGDSLMDSIIDFGNWKEN